MAAEHPSWNRAKTIAPELVRRYRKMCSYLSLETGVSDELMDADAVKLDDNAADASNACSWVALSEESARE